MKTYIISRGYPSKKYLMNGIFEFDQAKALRDNGCEVVLLAPDMRSLRRWRKWGFEQKSLDGVQVLAYNLPLGRIPDRIKLLIQRIVLDKLFRKAIKLYGMPDVIHAHFYHMGYVAAHTRVLPNIPLVITEHSSKMVTGIDKNMRRQAQKAYSSAVGVIAVSKKLKEIHQKEFNIRSVYIPNVVDIDLFKIYDNAKHDEKYCFVSIGSLIKRKGHEEAIHAFYKAFGHTPDVLFTIYGEGPQRAELQKLIDSYQLTDRVILAGMQSRETIAQEMSRCHCFVLLSKGETFGVAYIEAMATGLPVIATKCGGPETFVTPQNGVLVDVDDTNGAADAMKAITESNYNAELISQTVGAMFSGKAVAKQILDFYTRVIEGL